MQDKIGQEIKVGDFIAYGCSLDRSAGLQLGKVRGFNNNKIQIFNEQQAKVALSFPERCVVISSIYDPESPVISHYGWSREPKTINWEGGGDVIIIGGGGTV